MRNARRHIYFFILFLGLGVATREAAEIFELADDWSNEGTTATYQGPLPCPATRFLKRATVRGSIARRPRALARASKKRLWSGPTLSSASKAGPEILLLLSTQRK